MNLTILGLIFELVGVFILTLVAIFDYPHQRIFEEKEWWKRYWWSGWRPFYKNTQTLKWVTKWNHKPVVYGMLPPKYKLELIGLLFILGGFALQLIFYLK